VVKGNRLYQQYQQYQWVYRLILLCCLFLKGETAEAEEVTGLSRWQKVSWDILTQRPTWMRETLEQTWLAWQRGCQRPPQPQMIWQSLCDQVAVLAWASPDEKKAWLMQAFDVYQITDKRGRAEGLMTAYFEPVLSASRIRQGKYQFPIYRLPLRLQPQQKWLTRQELMQAAPDDERLRDLALFYLADPLDAMSLEIQGSGRLQVQEITGEISTVRVRFAGSNQHPYVSVGRWLKTTQGVKDVSWPGIQTWAQQHPGQIAVLLAQNPRVVFFKAEAAGDLSEDSLNEPLSAQEVGPIGAQGVVLTAGASIAIDPKSLPYGTPVWLSALKPEQLSSPADIPEQIEGLVLTQDTGSAIVGAVRADYFAGLGPVAGRWAGQIQHRMFLWALWPKAIPRP
jgi:membrane-bound lytic murein transglycosylase A